MCSCEQGPIGAEAASSLIKRVHGLVGAGHAGGGGSAGASSPGSRYLRSPLAVSLVMDHLARERLPAESFERLERFQGSGRTQQGAPF